MQQIRVKGLVAVYLPGAGKTGVPRPPKTVNTLRFVLNRYFGTHYPRAPMADEKSSYINTGNVSGTGIAIGTDAQATVTINQQTQQELLDLIQQLQTEIQNAQIPDGAKSVLLTKAIPEMSQAVQSEDPKSGFQRGLERIDEQLQGAGAAAEHASGIVSTVAQIAKTIGIPLLHAAPYLAALI